MSAARQLVLGIDFAPPKVRRYGLRDAHLRPLVSLGKGDDGRYRAAFRVPAEEAWGYPSLELRAGNSWPCLILDCDGHDGTERLHAAIDARNVLEPNWIVTRRRSGGSHAVWCLERPVHRGRRARSAPLRRFGRVSEYYREATEADQGYTGVLAHNPMSRGHRAGGRDLVTTWRRRKPYALTDGSSFENLGRVLPFGWRLPKLPTTDAGRHMTLFAAGMKWAGSPANLTLAVLPMLLALNQDLPLPLDQDEAEGIARSVERYRRRWIAEGRFYSAEQREAWGRRLGRKGGEKRRERLAERDAEILELHRQGVGKREIARRFGLMQSTVQWIIRRDAHLVPEERFLPLFEGG